MMLITLTVLLSVVYSVTGNCRASNVQTKSPTKLPEMVKQQLGEEPDGIDLNNTNITGVAVYYSGFPDEHEPEFRFLSICISSPQLDKNPTCRRLISNYGQFGKTSITKDDFVGFYRRCGDDPNFNFTERLH
ncbi:hypothetical protein V3C99_003870 [Haemonchus contortus]